MTWSPAGTWLAIGRSPIDLGDSWLAHSDATGLKQLTLSSAETRADLWSPDGSRIAGGASPGGGALPLVIAICTVGSGICRGYGKGSPVAWSPDGALLAFLGPESVSANAFTLDPGTGKVTLLLDATPTIGGLAWSRTGRLAAVGDDSSLLITRPGGAPVRLAPDLHVVGAPAWSPDGSWLVTTVDLSGATEILVLEVDGPGRARLTRDGGGSFAAWAPVP